MEVGGQCHAPTAVPLGKGPVTQGNYWRPGWTRGRSGLVRDSSPPPGFDPRTPQSVPSRYTDYAVRPPFL
jgi:hypothetical protein